jgi:ABC-2 type transport system permease protein
MQRDVPILVIDNDQSEMSRSLIRSIDAHEAVAVQSCQKGMPDVQDEIYRMKYMAVLIIPDNYSQMIKQGMQAKISLVANNSRFMVANDVLRGINDVISEISKNSVVQYYRTKGMINSRAVSLANPIQFDIRCLFNTTEAYGDFIIVGLLALIFQQTLVIAAAVSIAHEREERSIGLLYHKASGSFLRIIAGKGILYFSLFSIYTFFFFNFHFLIYKIPFNGSMLLLILVTQIQIVVLFLLGCIIGTFFRQKLFALIFLAFMSYPVFLLSGYSWPQVAFPEVIKLLSYMLPQTWYFNTYVSIAQEGGGVENIFPYIVTIVGIGCVLVLTLLLRMKSLRKNCDL